MAQIQTYPRKTTYDANDLILICDKTPDSNSAITNETKTITISTITDNLDVVDSLNSLKGNVNITSGSNISINTSGNNVQISSLSGGMGGSGTINYIPKFSASATLTNSVVFEKASKIGIGTIDPAAKLDILDTAAQSSIRVTNNSYNNYLIQKRRTDDTQIFGIKEFGSNGGLALVTGNTERLNINNLGNVGIGTDLPSTKLQVNGASGTTQSTIGYGTQNLYIGVSGTNVDLKSSGSSAGTFTFSTGNAERVRITSGGSVGIGTTSPSQKLEVIGAIQSNVGGRPVTLSSGQITIKGDTGGWALQYGFLGSSNAVLGGFGALGGVNSMSYFYIGADYNASNILVLKPDTGNVGIGITTPTSKLNVLDAVDRDMNANGTGQFQIGGNGYQFGIAMGSDTCALYTNSAGRSLTLGTNEVKRLEILGSGQVIFTGDGTNASKVRFNCSANSHYVEVVGPDHAGGASYSLKLPNTLPSVSNQILESNGSGILSWIPTPSGGGGGGGTVTSVGLSVPSAFGVSNSPITGNGNIALTTNLPGNTGSVQFKNASGDFAGDSDLIFSSGTLTVGELGGNGGFVVAHGEDGVDSGRIRIGHDNVTNHVTLGLGSASMSSNYIIDFPLAGPGGNDKILQSDSTGQLSWITTPSGGGSGPGGSSGQVQYRNAAGNFAGSSDLIFNDVSNALVVGENGGNQGLVILEGEDGVDSGILKIGHRDLSYYVSLGIGDTSMSASYSIDLPVAAPGSNNKILESNSSGQLSWISTPSGGGSVTSLTTSGSSGASTLTSGVLNIPQYSGGGSGGSLGFSPLEIYSANSNTTENYIYYCAAVCDVDVEFSKAKVAVISGTSDIYVGVYSMTDGNLQSSTLTLLGVLKKTTGVVAGINEIALAEGTITLTAGQNICIGVSTSNKLSAGTGPNNDVLGVMATSGGGSTLPASPAFETLGSANRRTAIHFYAS